MASTLGSFVLGQNVLGASATSNTPEYVFFKTRIYHNNKWCKATIKVMIDMVVPTNAIVDVNNVPILTSDGEFILVDESTEGLTPEYIYSEWTNYASYINAKITSAVAQNVIYSSANTPAYYSNNQPIYYKQ